MGGPWRATADSSLFVGVLLLRFIACENARNMVAATTQVSQKHYAQTLPGTILNSVHTFNF